MRAWRFAPALLLIGVPHATADTALPPGKPAGLLQAQTRNYDAIAIGALVVILGVGIWMAAGTTYTVPSDTAH